MDFSIVDETLQFSDSEAFSMCHSLHACDFSNYSLPTSLPNGCVNYLHLHLMDRLCVVRLPELAKCEGLMVGGSAGGNVFAAVEVAKRVRGPAVITTILCDHGIKYLSKVFSGFLGFFVLGVGDCSRFVHSLWNFPPYFSSAQIYNPQWLQKNGIVIQA